MLYVQVRDGQNNNFHKPLLKAQMYKVRKLAQKSKAGIIRSKLEHGNSKQLFTTVKSLSVPVTRTLPEGYDNDLGLANAFAEFFEFKISSIVSRFESTGATWSDSNPCTVSGIVRFDDFEPLSERDVGLLRRVKCTPNLDVLPQTQFSEMFALMLPFISKLINSSLSSGVFPSCFKKSQISPLLKSTDHDPNELNSYQPIFNLLSVSKMIETAVNNQFMAHLESNSLLNSHQSAYRKGHSVETAFQRVYSLVALFFDGSSHTLSRVLFKSE